MKLGLPQLASWNRTWAVQRNPCLVTPEGKIGAEKSREGRGRSGVDAQLFPVHRGGP